MIMKLSNIFLSTLVVLLCCTACSKDDESFKGKDADASLSIAVKVAGSAVTKGFHPNDENELAGEAKVNNLSVLVFDESGAQLIGYGWQATNSEGEASERACYDHAGADRDRFQYAGKFACRCYELFRFRIQAGTTCRPVSEQSGHEQSGHYDSSAPCQGRQLSGICIDGQ